MEGELLGEGDGPDVGGVEGEPVGCTDGEGDGPVVGGAEGVMVGCELGGVEGVPVGCADGEADGCADGEDVVYLQSFPSRTRKGPI